MAIRIFTFPFRLLYKLYFAVYFGVSLLLFYPLFKLFLLRKKRFPTAFKLMRFYAKIWMFFMGIRITIKGKENLISGKPFLICANHSSFIDIACLYIIMDEYFVFTGKKEIERWPLFRVFYTSGMNILVDRNSKNGNTNAFKMMLETVEKGYPLAIFPEGTISKNAPLMNEFKSGATTLAIQKQIPIVPITFTTNWKRLQRKGLWSGKASPGNAEVIIHPAIATVGLTKKDADRLQSDLFVVINRPLKQFYLP